MHKLLQTSNLFERVSILKAWLASLFTFTFQYRVDQWFPLRQPYDRPHEPAADHSSIYEHYVEHVGAGALVVAELDAECAH